MSDVENTNLENKEKENVDAPNTWAKLTKSNPVIRMVGHLFVGSSAAIFMYIAGNFISASAKAIGYLALSNQPLGLVMGGMTLVGYLGYVVLFE